LTYNYFYISTEGLRLEASLETHSNNDLDSNYIDNNGFQELANNLGINLEEFRFKYSVVSEICEHPIQVLERCYNLSKVLHIFSELKAGLMLTKDYPCCYSKSWLCSSEMRDVVCHRQISTYPQGYAVNAEKCLLNEGAYWELSTQRLRAEGALFYVGDKEYTIEKSPMDIFQWERYFKKRNNMIKKALRLDSQVSLIYRNKENISEYY
jgi:hypothetical protein